LRLAAAREAKLLFARHGDPEDRLTLIAIRFVDEI